MGEVRELVALIKDLNDRGLTGGGVAINIATQCTHPAKERAHPAYEFAEEIDMTWEAPEPAKKEDLVRRLEKFFSSGTRITSYGCLAPFSLGNPWLEVISCLMRLCF